MVVVSKNHEVVVEALVKKKKKKKSDFAAVDHLENKKVTKICNFIRKIC